MPNHKPAAEIAPDPVLRETSVADFLSFYDRRGYGDNDTGLGVRPAVLVIDFQQCVHEGNAGISDSAPMTARLPRPRGFSTSREAPRRSISPRLPTSRTWPTPACGLQDSVAQSARGWHRGRDDRRAPGTGVGGPAHRQEIRVLVCRHHARGAAGEGSDRHSRSSPVAPPASASARRPSTRWSGDTERFSPRNAWAISIRCSTPSIWPI